MVDFVFQQVRDKNVPFGGMQVIAGADVLQVTHHSHTSPIAKDSFPLVADSFVCFGPTPVNYYNSCFACVCVRQQLFFRLAASTRPDAWSARAAFFL